MSTPHVSTLICVLIFIGCNDGYSHHSHSEEQSRDEGWFVQDYRIGAPTSDSLYLPLMNAWVEEITFYKGFVKRPVGRYHLLLQFDTSQFNLQEFVEREGSIVVNDWIVDSWPHSSTIVVIYVDTIPMQDTLYARVIRYPHGDGSTIQSIPLIKNSTVTRRD